jgi:hypothetical protein
MYLMMWLCPVVFMLGNLQKLISNCGFPDHNWCCSRENSQRQPFLFRRQLVRRHDWNSESNYLSSFIWTMKNLYSSNVEALDRQDETRSLQELWHSARISYENNVSALFSLRFEVFLFLGQHIVKFQQLLSTLMGVMLATMPLIAFAFAIMFTMISRISSKLKLKQGQL